MKMIDIVRAERERLELLRQRRNRRRRDVAIALILAGLLIAIGFAF